MNPAAKGAALTRINSAIAEIRTENLDAAIRRALDNLRAVDRDDVLVNAAARAGSLLTAAYIASDHAEAGRILWRAITEEVTDGWKNARSYLTPGQLRELYAWETGTYPDGYTDMDAVMCDLSGHDIRKALGG